MSYRYTVNLGNSIIGVSILAMPYLFHQCGIALSIVLIIVSGMLNRMSCHFLLKSAILTKRRSYELLAYQAIGPKGKLIVELGILGFLFGTCVAFFVVVGDLGPSLVGQLFGLENGPQLRAFVMTFLGMFVALPLGLLRRLDSLTSFSALSLGLYAFLILKLFSEASMNMFAISSWESATSDKSISNSMNWWSISSILTALPIFSMALACQTQLFEIFESSMILSDDYNSIKKMNNAVKGAVNICSIAYIMVGLFGYIAFFQEPLGGNILLHLPQSFTSSLTKLMFIITVLISLPLCLFPCRTSLHSLLFRKGSYSLLNDVSGSPSLYMSDSTFRLLTIVLIVVTIGVSVLLPHIEIVLGIVGSTIGSIICFILPAMIFISLTTKNTTERLMAHFVGIIGIFVLIACTYSTLQNMNEVIPMDAIRMHGGIKNQDLIPAMNKEIYVQAEATKMVIKQATLPSRLADSNLRKVNTSEIVENQSNVKFNMDAAKIKKQEDLLQRLEKQQEEHRQLLEEQKKVLSEIKRHEKTHHTAPNIEYKSKNISKDIPKFNEESNKPLLQSNASIKDVRDIPEPSLRQPVKSDNTSVKQIDQRGIGDQRRDSNVLLNSNVTNDKLDAAALNESKNKLSGKLEKPASQLKEVVNGKIVKELKGDPNLPKRDTLSFDELTVSGN